MFGFDSQDDWQEQAILEKLNGSTLWGGCGFREDFLKQINPLSNICVSPPKNC